VVRPHEASNGLSSRPHYAKPLIGRRQIFVVADLGEEPIEDRGAALGRLTLSPARTDATEFWPQ
jgi:hypothetical protein